MSSLTYQQNVVMEDARTRLASLYEFNAALRKRVALVCAASTTIVGIVTAAKFLPTKSTEFAVESIILGVVCLLSVVMYWVSASALLPSTAPIPGSTDTDVLFDQYISKDEQTAYNNFLIDICEANNVALKSNSDSAKILKKAIFTFQIQLGFLGLAIAWSGFSSF